MSTMIKPTGTMHANPSVLTPDPRLFGAPNEEKNIKFYRKMYFIRRFEETLLSLFDEGILNGTTHACIGQEADCVGVMEHLTLEDHVFSNHRCHGHYLARTGDAAGLLAEIMGKQTGVSGGRGGSQHICGPGFKSNGIQGGIVPAAAGIALANKLRGTGGLSVVFIGDGTLGEGVVYETMNIASLWGLPLFVVVEDNGWSQSTPSRLNLAGDMAARFTAFDIPVLEISSTDVLEIDQAAHKGTQQARDTQQPVVLIIHTYRLCHHSKNDDCRPPEEVAERHRTEPLVIHGPRLNGGVRGLIESEVEEALREVISQVRSLP
jgi:TPP-dependent pyruvate/acetoin dehydrogenase alpha subunit